MGSWLPLEPRCGSRIPAGRGRGSPEPSRGAQLGGPAKQGRGSRGPAGRASKFGKGGGSKERPP